VRSLLPAFGNGETISPGIYSISGASITGNLTLDGGGNSISIFVIKQMALWPQAQIQIILTNGTS
jgi:hypothetical protein